MDLITFGLIAGSWVALAIFVVSLCVSSSHADLSDERLHRNISGG